VDLSDDLPSPRRALFFPVVIATVFLTIIGMSAGIALASWHKAQKTGDQPQSISTPTYEPPTSPAPSGEPCRPESQSMGRQAGAQGVLRIQLLLRTKSSAVWICEDEGGRYYYHANKVSADDEWTEGVTALFLTGVQPDGSGGYAVIAADGTAFTITKQRLVIVHRDGRKEVQEAVG